MLNPYDGDIEAEKEHRELEITESAESLELLDIDVAQKNIGQKIWRLIIVPFDILAQQLVDLGIEPVRLTASKIPLTLGAIALHFLNPIAGTTAFVIASITDVLDGKVARLSNKTSEVGALIDAFTDKVVNAYMYLYLLSLLPQEFMNGDFILVFLIIFMASMDVISQRMRDPLGKQLGECLEAVRHPDQIEYSAEKTNKKANNAGKTKAVLQFIGITTALISLNHPVTRGATIGLFTAAALCGIKSVQGRMDKTPV